MLDLTSLYMSRSELSKAVDNNDLKRLTQLIIGPKYINLNYLDKSDGQSLLHKACRLGYLSIARFLVENGASQNFQDKCGWFPLHLASFYGHMEIVVYLLGSSGGKATESADDSDKESCEEDEEESGSSDVDELDAKFCVFSLD